MEKYRLVKVEWQDACGNTRWETIESAKKATPSFITSIGYLLRNDKKQVTVAASMSNNQNCADTTVIPRQWVLKIKYIKGQTIEC